MKTMEVTITLTDEQSKAFEQAIEVLDPIPEYGVFSNMIPALIEEFVRDMGITWPYGKPEQREETK